MTASSALAQLAHGSSALAALRGRASATAANGTVALYDWTAQVGPNGLTLSCTVTATAAGAVITGVGLLAYSADGAAQYGTQYTANTNTDRVFPSVTIGGIALPSGARLLAVVFGYIQEQEFYFEKILTV